jgi:hypothetical protein
MSHLAHALPVPSPMRRAVLVLIALTVAVAACESDSNKGAVGRVRSDDFDLQGTAALVRDGKVDSGKELETQINKNPKNRIDTDGDGRKDRLQVVETRGESARTLTVRAIPSTTARATNPSSVAVPIATLEFVPNGERAKVTVAYADTVLVTDPEVIAFDQPVLVGTFCYWVLIIERPIFIGVAYVVVQPKKHRKW